MPHTPHFPDHELRCKHCGENKMDQGFLDRLEKLRVRFGKPLRLSSAYRCPDYNSQVSSTGRDGPHTTGKAVDILIHNQEAHTVLQIALDMGFRGIGISQKGLHSSRFIHLDDLDSPVYRPNVWSY